MNKRRGALARVRACPLRNRGYHPLPSPANLFGDRDLFVRCHWITSAQHHNTRTDLIKGSQFQIYTMSPHSPKNHSPKHKDDHKDHKCDHQHKKGDFSTIVKNGFVPGLFIVTANIPGAMTNPDGSLCTKKVVCCHEDHRTSGASVVIPWAQFDKRDGADGGYFDWDFVDQQMEPWVARGQVVNLLVWPAVQKKDQLFPNGGSATPDYIMNQPNMTYQCPDGSAQSGCCSEGIPLPKFWKPEVYQRYGQALTQFVRRYEDHPNVNYFRFGIGVGAESYPGVSLVLVLVADCSIVSKCRLILACPFLFPERLHDAH